jgi:uncharacterized protein (DUF2345 family)
MSLRQNAGQNHNITAAKKFFKHVSDSIYVTTETNENCIHNEF